MDPITMSLAGGAVLGGISSLFAKKPKKTAIPTLQDILAQSGDVMAGGKLGDQYSQLQSFQNVDPSSYEGQLRGRLSQQLTSDPFARQAIDSAAATQASGQAQAQQNMMMRGGLNSGARERMATQGGLQSALARQEALRGAQGERQNLIAQLANQEGAARSGDVSTTLQQALQKQQLAAQLAGAKASADAQYEAARASQPSFMQSLLGGAGQGLSSYGMGKMMQGSNNKLLAALKG